MAQKRSSSETPRSSASKFGQMIGEAFEKVVIRLIKDYLQSDYPAYELLEPEEGRKRGTLELLGGNIRQLDTVITEIGSADPVALLETKWLKDARHHNDKGSWILQLREMQKKYPKKRIGQQKLPLYQTKKS